MKLVGITGGIGAGKTTFSKVLEALGYKVYNCDVRAKELMVNSDILISKIKIIFGEDAYFNGELNKKHIAQLAFNDKTLLQKLNNAVHPVVDEDIKIWAQNNSSDELIFVESAILFESGLYKMMNFSVNVSAPLDLRVQRVCKRDNVTSDVVNERISNQMSDEERNEKSDYIIICDDKSSIIQQAFLCIENLLEK